MTAKPLIGISGSHMIDGGGQFPGYHRSYVNHDYVRSVTEAGGIPLIIPFNEEDDVVEALMDRVDGLLLSGGHPSFMGKNLVGRLARCGRNEIISTCCF